MPGKHTKKEPINRGIGNYKGSGNFAMKNKMLSDSAKNGMAMQKNYDGMPNKYWTAIKEAAKGSNLTTAKQRYDYSLKESKKKEAESESTGQTTTTQGMPKNRKSVAGEQEKLETKQKKREKKGDKAAITGKFKKARRNYKKSDKLKAKIEKNQKTVDRAVDNVMSNDYGMPKMSKMPTLPPKKLKTKASFYGQTGPSKPDEKMNRKYS
jgi:hypothetical protein